MRVDPLPVRRESLGRADCRTWLVGWFVIALFPGACQSGLSSTLCEGLTSVEDPGQSDVRKNKSDLPKNPESFSFFVTGDTRSEIEEFQTNLTSMAAMDPHAIALFVNGDITADGTAKQWHEHHLALAGAALNCSVPNDPSGIVRQSLFRTNTYQWGNWIRYIGVLGNHDVNAADWYRNWNRFLPGQQSLGHVSEQGIYFAIPYQSAIFIVLDSVHPSSAQTAWLSQLLSRPVVSGATWKFVFFHHPVYPCNKKEPFAAGLEWISLFEQHGIDVVFVAHSHTYERTCSMVRGKCVDGGVVYINSSAGGAAPRAIDSDRRATVENNSRKDRYDCSEILVAGRGDWRHFCHFRVQQTTLTVSCASHNDPTKISDHWQVKK